ncbi:MAG: hypothetical protein IKV89_02240 [Clostridia bacterium]|nr:hypothetical protein [Clostridia bacterium]
MNAKIKILISVLAIGLMLISACSSDDVKEVTKVPEGFIRLPECGELENMSWMGWETQIVFLDEEENCIYQTGFNNSEFIVWYKDDYYVNEEKFKELLEKVKDN